MSGSKDWRVTVEVKATTTGRLFDSTLCIRDSNSVPLADPLAAQTVADDVAAWLAPLWRPVTNAGLTVQRVLTRELGTSSPTSAESIIAQVGTLTAGTGTLPSGCCMWLHAKTNLATRSGRGGFHFPPPYYSSFLNTSDSWATGSAYYTAANAIRTALLAGTTVTHDTIAHDYSWRVWSDTRNASEDVTQSVIRLEPKWLRSRMTTP